MTDFAPVPGIVEERLKRQIGRVNSISRELHDKLSAAQPTPDEFKDGKGQKEAAIDEAAVLAEMEAAVLAEMTAKLEAEGLASSAPALPSQTIAGCIEDARALQVVERGESDDEAWRLSQQPAPLAYLREIVQLARESGMVYIRTGNLEMKFDADARKTASAGERSQF